MFVSLTAGLSEDVLQSLGHPSLVRVLLLAALHPPSDHLLDPQQGSQQVLCDEKNKKAINDRYHLENTSAGTSGQNSDAQAGTSDNTCIDVTFY